MPSQRQLRAKMNEQREEVFRPRMWHNGGHPLTKDVLSEAMANADENDANRELAKFSIADEDGTDESE